jgi:hypothetical protein
MTISRLFALGAVMAFAAAVGAASFDPAYSGGDSRSYVSGYKSTTAAKVAPPGTKGTPNPSARPSKISK